MGWSVVVMEKPIATPPHFWPFATDGVPQTFQNFDVVSLIHCGALGEILVVNNTLGIKENCQHDLDVGSNLASFLGLGDVSPTHWDDWTFVSMS